MTIKTIGKNRGNVFIWLALLVFSLIMPCVALATDTLIKVEEQPQNASRWRGTSSGAAIIAVVTGGTGGAVWGTGVYTDDSSISAAAVHANVLASGETGLVAITILPGQTSYTGSDAHGVKTKPYGSYDGSYSIAAYSYEIDTTVIADPGNFARWGNFADWKTEATKTFKVRLIGVNSGSIWGTDTYTSDSLLALAAVHAKALSAAEHGDVSVTLSAGRDSYVGSTQNGVSSSSWGSYGSSYTFAAGAGCTATIDKSLLLHIPFCTYEESVFGTMSLWIDLVYEFRPLAVGTLPIFKLINYGNNDAGATCSDPAATLSSTLRIVIPEVLFPDGSIHNNMVLDYSTLGDSDGYVYFDLTSYDTP